jgi:hypothetical protein
MSAPALLVMAAGMGSRYGGAKQIDGVGPRGETLLEYSLYDARRAGFGRVVFVTRRDLADAFATLTGRLPADFDVRIVYQTHDQVPSWFIVERCKSIAMIPAIHWWKNYRPLSRNTDSTKIQTSNFHPILCDITMTFSVCCRIAGFRHLLAPINITRIRIGVFLPLTVRNHS